MPIEPTGEERGGSSGSVGGGLVCPATRVRETLRQLPSAKCLQAADVRDCPTGLVSAGGRVRWFELSHPFASRTARCPRLAAIVRRESMTDTQ